MNKKKLIIPIVAGIATVGIITGVTYAFFSANIVENNKTETVIKTNTLGLTYTGDTEINASNMIPGDSFTKTFKVENTSNIAVTYNIYMENVLNEFNEDLVYTLTDETGKVIEETALPETNNGKTYLKTNIYIDSNTTKTYTLKVEYKYLDTPQNDYQGKTFTTTVGIDTEQNTIAFSGLCKRATTLHTEECLQTDETRFCSGSGYTASNKGTTVTYGNIGNRGKLKSGDAFDCDVNGDGIYNSENERFYYVSDYYNTQSKQFETDKATLIYYSNTVSGVPNSTGYSLTAYYLDANENWHGPATVVKWLPTQEQWNNVSLINSKRQILNELGTTITTGGNLPVFDYTGYAARLLTVQEVNNACQIVIGSGGTGLLNNCYFLVENSQFTDSSRVTLSGWLETAYSGNSTNAWNINAYYNGFENNTSPNIYGFGTRPAIEVAKDNIEI